MVETGDGPVMRPRSDSIFWLRGALAAIGLLLALALLSRGNVLIGGLLGVMAVTRVVMLVALWRRRERWRSSGRPFPPRS